MVSIEISKRLQSGWTLLNEHCPMPSCGTPLLKDHKNEIYCAKCQMYCISADKAKSLGVSNGKASAPAAAGYGAAREQQQASAPAPAPAEARQQSRAAAEAAMGEKLLLGWTMLAQECPTAGCCFPLMRDRSSNTTCVACGGNGVAAATSLATAAPRDTPHEGGTDTNSQFADRPAEATTASTTVIVPPPAPPAAQGSDNTTGEPEPMLSKEEFAAARKKRDALSAALGRYMLQGWSLSDRTCPRRGCEPGTPLLKNRGTGTFYCAACDTRMREGETGGLLAESTTESTKAAGSTTGLPLKRASSGERNRSVPVVAQGGDVPSAPTKEKPMQVESEYELAERARLRKQAAREQQGSGGYGAASATLAQRLLQGWAMLSATCPEAGCHNPLMRDRTGKEQCVSCSSSSSSVKATALPTPRREPDAAAVPAQAAGDFAGEMETEDEEDQALLDDRAGRMYSEGRMKELLAVSAGGPSDGTERAGKSDVEADTAADRLRIQNQALDSLYRALDVSQQRLRACSSSLGSFDVNESMRQADLIAKLVVATRAVSGLSSCS
eukprot:g9178.t1